MNHGTAEIVVNRLDKRDDHSISISGTEITGIPYGS
ncbi:hypothetical protein EDE15_0485 [Edaphobacter aggregans]|uniref:Uncharacterized protein n=1 Tax=Edaphobacter aggregans TaxID=570835 RepID=A0A3R9Q754_9BACT|nr:hypothetical protein EDE15_0485 [Edaphobacter aggregans]